MGENCGDLDFPEEPLMPERCRKLRTQNLDGHPPVMLEILGQVDYSHPSLASLPHDAVARGQGSSDSLELLRVVAHDLRLPPGGGIVKMGPPGSEGQL